MRRAKRVWQGALIAGAAALILFLVVPVFGTSPGPDADRLRLTDDVDAFFYGSHQPVPGPGVTIQDVSASKSCVISPLSGPLVTWGSDGGGSVKGPGIVKHAIGVKSGGAKGTPCSETSNGERLVIVGANPWIKLRLDIEAKGNAWIHVELFNGPIPAGHHHLLTGGSIENYNTNFKPPADPDETPAPGFPYMASTSVGNEIEACTNPSDSGPDSGPNDNCLWTIDPGTSFNKIVLYTTAGSVALKGGGDFANVDPTAFANGDFDSLFYRANQAPVAGDDSFEMDERNKDDLESADTLDADLLGNDDPVDGDTIFVDSVGALASTEVDDPGTLQDLGGGVYRYEPTLLLQKEPSPSTPEVVDSWDDVEGNSYDVTFDYVVSDGQATDTGTVTITVHRVICSGESVADTSISGTVTGEFTLLSVAQVCKRYLVDALDAIDGDPATITFAPEPNGDEAKESFRGVLTFDPILSADGGFFLGLRYDPDNDLIGGLGTRDLLPCEAPEFDPVTGELIGATLPDAPPGSGLVTETWCLAAGSFVASSDGYIPTAYVYGEEDPRFNFR